MIGTRQYREMESSCASALPVREPENIEAAGKARERETNVSDPLEAPQAAEGRETNAPCRREMPESMGTWETNVSEKETATARDGEQLTSAAQERRQEKTAVAEHQAVGGSSSPSQDRTVAKDIPHQVCPDPGAGDQVEEGG